MRYALCPKPSTRYLKLLAVIPEYLYIIQIISARRPNLIWDFLDLGLRIVDFGFKGKRHGA